MANRNEEKGEEHMREDGMEYTGAFETTMV